MQKMSGEQSGARFFDENKRDRGWASKVTKRSRSLGGLTVLDVITTEPSLASFLMALDKARLRVQYTDVSGESYTFKWASGYENGTEIRIQGVLDEP
jgi:hypothetical protein